MSQDPWDSPKYSYKERETEADRERGENTKSQNGQEMTRATVCREKRIERNSES